MSQISCQPGSTEQTHERARVGSPVSVFTTALRLGMTSFGGPVAHLGYFREEYVVRRGWLDDQAYSELVGLCQFLPGPASSQVGFAVGWSRAGPAGAILAWLAFTLPSALLMFGLALATRSLHGRIADAVLHGLKLAAIAVVAQAVIGMARTLTPDFRRMAMASLAAAAMVSIADPAAQILLIAAGAIVGLVLCEPGAVPPQHRGTHAPSRPQGLIALAAFALLIVALPALAGLSGWLKLAGVFYRSGALVFGGGHVVLPLLREGLVPGWMNDAGFLAGYGAAQAVPGPLFSIASYLGAVAVPSAPLAGAAMATIAIFLPGLLLVTGALAFRQSIMGAAWARRAMAGVNATVVGILAAAVYNPLWTTAVTGLADIAIAGVGLVLLVRFKLPSIVVVALCVAINAAATV